VVPGGNASGGLGLDGCLGGVAVVDRSIEPLALAFFFVPVLYLVAWNLILSRRLKIVESTVDALKLKFTRITRKLYKMRQGGSRESR